MLVENILHSLHILGRTYEGVGNKVDVLVDGKQYVLTVLLCDGRQVDVSSWHVHTLARAKHALVLHLSDEHWSRILHHLHVECSVIEQDMVTHLHILGDIHVCQVYDVMTCLHLWSSEDLHHITNLIVDTRFLILIHKSGGSHLGSFRVNKDSDVWRYGTRIPDNLAQAISRGMRRIHTYHVHSRQKQLA